MDSFGVLYYNKFMDIIKMKEAGALAAATLDHLEQFLKPGITTNELNDLCHKFILKNKGHPGALNYKGFPKSICISINNEVCHGIPKNQKLKSNDLVKMDVVVKKEGHFGDTCRAYIIGAPQDPTIEQLLQVTYHAMMEGIKIVKPGIFINDIGIAVENYVKSFGFSCVRDFCGHGIGTQMHMDPYVPNFDNGFPGMQLTEGMTFTIEPMVNVGHFKVKILSDGWTVVTSDGSLSCQWEHTILVTATGYEILTLSAKEKALQNISKIENI
jgi:methionyl aminopeptidase